MLLHRNNRRRYQVRVPLTSLIDIVFLLLIYFLLTTNFMVDEGIKIKLPQAKASSPQIQSEITVYVDQEGRAFLEKQEVTPGDLFERLREIIGEQKDRLVVVRADRDVILNKAVRIMDVVKAAGAGRLCLATEKEL
ncbi:MAG: biopolymer transporter ExbD [Thermodesulfobacteriota bacterium]|nr:biopolymer transporter ExbD [Thermodesulfobacteriota bacterium]